MTDIILHHYAASPFSEKVRIAFGIKQARLEVGRDPQHHAQARPDAADRRLSQDAGDADRRRHLLRHPAHHAGDREARCPTPPLLPKGREGEARAHHHVDRPQHLLARRRRGHGPDRRQAVGEAFKKDRSEFSGRSFDPERLQAALPMVARPDLRPAVAGRGDAGRRPHVPAGRRAGLADCALYNPVWFIQEQLGAARPAPLDRLPEIVAWSRAHEGARQRQAHRHQGGRRARHRQGGQARRRPASMPNDPSGLKAGQKISVTPDDTGKVPVTGALVGLAPDRISIKRSDARVGDVVVHFPRAGFIVQPAIARPRLSAPARSRRRRWRGCRRRRAGPCRAAGSAGPSRRPA